jgi:inorganic pyrophosphatase
MQDDYEADDRQCLTTAIFPDEEFCRRVQKTIIDALRSIEPIHYYYPPEDLHLTMKNISTVDDTRKFDDADIERIKRIFRDTMNQYPPFTFNMSGILRFPTSLALIGYSSSILGRLVQDLDQQLDRSGLPDNKSYVSDEVFFGSITICRFRHAPSPALISAIEEYVSIDMGSLQVQEVSLLTCNAVCLKKSRTILDTFHLNGGPHQARQFLYKEVDVVVDRSLGSLHPTYHYSYPINYGYVPGTVSGDGEEIDAYILGVHKPIKTFTGICIGVIKREQDDDDKLILVPEGTEMTDEEIWDAIHFQEKWFSSKLLRS